MVAYVSSRSEEMQASAPFAERVGSDRRRVGVALREPALQLVTTFVVLSTLYAVLAFRNFSALSVVLLQAVFVVTPVGLLYRALRRYGTGYRPKFKLDWFVSGTGSCFFLLLQFAALSDWESYYTNFATTRLALGGGFHEDSAFHVAIIQNVLSTGIASTGQHLSPFIPYHVLSHHFDAAIIRVFAFDAWESYALLFYAKSSLMLMCVVYFVRVGLRAERRLTFWFLLAVMALAWIATWHVVGSHAQWVPMALLLLVAPWLHSVLVSDRVSTRNMILLTALVIILTLGKGSIGLSFAVCVGFLLLFLGRLSTSVFIGGALWAAALAYWAGMTGQSSSGRWLKWPAEGLQGLMVWAHEIVTALLLIAGLALISRMRNKDSRGHRIAAAALASLSAITLVAVFVANGPSEAFYYFSGLFAVMLVTVGPLLLLHDEVEEHCVGLQSMTLVVGFALAVSPVLAVQPLGPYTGLAAPFEVARDADAVTYRWLNENRTESERVTVFRARGLRTVSGTATLEEQSTLTRLGRASDALLHAEGISRRRTVLFVPLEAFAELEILEAGPGWAHGLLITAVTGFPLVHGVPVESSPFYGFQTYRDLGDDVFQRELMSVTSESLCEYGRTVIVVESISRLSLRLECSEANAAD